ncbi:MAG TPA: ABC transporter substrate-binding protein, partial [Candidatus Nitrosotenuis sp.]|nr:ABC transporter substrate-binding protein [Candidatus Nitrosotenuis sp.]
MRFKIIVFCFLIGALLFKPCYSDVTHGISIWGALKYKPDFQFLDYVNPEAPKGGRLNYGEVGTFDSLNPFIVRGSAPVMIGLTVARLMDEPHDVVGEYYAWVAEGVELAPDRTWITFYLNPKAKFSDGHPITADDVIWSFETLRDQGLPFYRTYYKNVSRVEKLTDHKVRFYLSTTKNRELPCILGQIPVLPKHYFQDHTFNETFLIPPPCSGPYQIDSVDAGRSLTLKRVKNWWGDTVPS